mmetsp:Transcript_8020/g.23944  ORF Transcript_8020/g.23944 Transcript_8020/m.23944 type:complete len:489 (-) Transcript_8020:922-2388(-)
MRASAVAKKTPPAPIAWNEADEAKEDPRPASLKSVSSIDKVLAAAGKFVSAISAGDGERGSATRVSSSSQDSQGSGCQVRLGPLPSDDGTTPVSVRTFRSVSPTLPLRPSFPARVTASTLSPVPRQSSQRARYPMHGMPVSRLLKLRGPLRRHEACLKSGLVTRIPPRAPVIFVSHQWLSFAHPDPRCIQLRRLQAMLRRVTVDRDSSLFAPDDWDAFARGVDARKTKSALHARAMRSDTRELTWEGFADELAGAYVWLDYFSIPQRDDQKFPRRHVLAGRSSSSSAASSPTTPSARSPSSVSERHLPRTMSTQKAAIVSIPAYVERTHYFVVLAPRAAHEDTGAVCDLESWRKRGWCRLEEWSNFLTIQKSNPLVLTEHPRVHVEEMADVGGGVRVPGARRFRPESRALGARRSRPEWRLPGARRGLYAVLELPRQHAPRLGGDRRLHARRGPRLLPRHPQGDVVVQARALRGHVSAGTPGAFDAAP